MLAWHETLGRIAHDPMFLLPEDLADQIRQAADLLSQGGITTKATAVTVANGRVSVDVDARFVFDMARRFADCPLLRNEAKAWKRHMVMFYYHANI